MPQPARARLVAAIGLAFVVVLLSNVVVLAPPPATGASAGELAEFVGGNQSRLLFAALLDAIAVTLFTVLAPARCGRYSSPTARSATSRSQASCSPPSSREESVVGVSRWTS